MITISSRAQVLAEEPLELDRANTARQAVLFDNITLILNPFQQVDIKYKLPRLDEGELEVETSVKIKTIKRKAVKIQW